MSFRIKIVALLLTITTISVSAQSNDPDKQRADYEKKLQEEFDSRINEFVADLKADDFQKEIIKQKMHSYYKKRKEIFLKPELKYFERDEQLSTLEQTHFLDIKEVIPETCFEQIKIFIKDGGAELKKEKKKKGKKKKKE